MEEKKLTTKWYNRSIEVVTGRNFLSVLLFITSLALWLLQETGDSVTARGLSILTFSFGVGQYIGSMIGEKYNEMKRLPFPFTFIFAVVGMIFWVFGDLSLSITQQMICASIAGLCMGTDLGFGLQNMRKRNLID